MSWGEAFRITQVLLTDPSSQVGAATSGWAYALSREALTLADLYDLQHRAKARKKPMPYPRPWTLNQRRVHGTARLSKSQLVALLAAHRGEEVADG